MTDIPEDVMKAARDASSYIMNTPDYLTCSIIARVILAERIKRDNKIDSLKKVITGILDAPRVDVNTDCHMGVYIYEEAVLVTSDAFRYAVRKMEEYKK